MLLLRRPGGPSLRCVGLLSLSPRCVHIRACCRACGASAVLNLSPKVTLNLGPKVSTTSTAGTSQLDTAAILAAIKLAMAPIATRLAALERSTMPPPGAKVGRPRHLSEQSDQHGQDAPQADPPEPGAQGEEDFTVVARTGKGRRSRGKANVTGQILEQARQANPTLTSYAGAAAAAANIPQPPAQRKGSSPPHPSRR